MELILLWALAITLAMASFEAMWVFPFFVIACIIFIIRIFQTY